MAKSEHLHLKHFRIESEMGCDGALNCHCTWHFLIFLKGCLFTDLMSCNKVYQMNSSDTRHVVAIPYFQAHFLTFIITIRQVNTALSLLFGIIVFKQDCL